MSVRSVSEIAHPATGCAWAAALAVALGLARPRVQPS
jgi:hypothetical protein